MYAILNTRAEVTCSQPCDHQFMRSCPAWTSSHLIVKIPKIRWWDKRDWNNLEFFTSIKGIEVKEAPKMSDLKLN